MDKKRVFLRHSHDDSHNDDDDCNDQHQEDHPHPCRHSSYITHTSWYWCNRHWVGKQNSNVTIVIVAIVIVTIVIVTIVIVTIVTITTVSGSMQVGEGGGDKKLLPGRWCRFKSYLLQQYSLKILPRCSCNSLQGHSAPQMS